MPSIPSGDGLHFCHNLIYRTQDDTVRRFVSQHRTSATKTKPFTNANGKAHATFEGDVYLEDRGTLFVKNGITES
jgi:hypothetical protein